LTKEALAGLHT